MHLHQSKHVSSAYTGTAAHVVPCLLPSPCHSRSVGARRSGVVTHALPDWMRSFFDMGSWAPKSTRIWRLQEYEYPESKPDEVDELQAKINKLRAANRSSLSDEVEQDQEEVKQVLQGKAEQAGRGSTSSRSSIDDLPALGSFTDAGDLELSKALTARINQSLTGTVEVEQVEEEDDDAEETVPELTGQEMRQLLLTKYGKTYDCSFVRRDIPGKTFVSLNIMWQHLEQRSFRLTEEQYDEKISSIAHLLNVLGQTQKIRTFLQEPAKSQRGLPRRPVVGTAISVQLDLEPEILQEFFGAGYQ